MRTRTIATRIGATALTLTALAFASSQALGAQYWLSAGLTTMADPNGGAAIPVWGYATCTPSFASCGAVAFPGPALSVGDTDPTLTVNLRNDLPGGASAPPTSLVINGLYKPMAPVFTNDAEGRRRVRSFDAEASPNGGTNAVYTWHNVKPGTYLYQSGTQPQVQVQMGLYGALAKNAVEPVPGTTRAQAYAGAANEYDSQATLLYSEIDPALHAAVADGTYGSTGPTSTFNYNPKYFLINGAPYQYGTTPSISASGTTLLRLLNAGLTTHVPTIQGKHWDIIAEDGKPYPFKRDQYTALMPAAKTLDVLLAPDIGGARYPILDRRLNLSNAGTSNGGMLAFLQYGVAGVGGTPAPEDTNAPPVAVADIYESIAGVELSVGPALGVLGNDDDTDTLPNHIKAVAAAGPTALPGGSYALNSNGSFIYTPPATITSAIADTFTYAVTDGKAVSSNATVTINLAVPVAPGPAVLDNFNRAASTAGLGSDWEQAVSTTSTNLQLNGTQAIAAATDVGGLAIWIGDTDPSAAVDTGPLGPKQYAAFTSSVLEKSALILKATGGTLKQPANFVRVRVEGTDIVIATMVGGSNAAVYVKQAAFPAGASSGTLSAVVDAKGLVTVFLGGVFKGGVQLPDVGAWKGGGRIGIQLQTLGATVDNFSGGNLP
jgi:FtsP/CotA-like multicopper oxidase with cupredoxin domain